MNGGHDGGAGFPPPDGGQWPNTPQGGTPYAAPGPGAEAPQGGQGGYGGQPGAYGGQGAYGEQPAFGGQPGGQNDYGTQPGGQNAYGAQPGGQDAYGAQPGYGTQPGGQDAYGTPSGGYGGGYGAYGAGAEPPKKRKGLVIGLIVGAVVVLVGVVALIGVAASGGDGKPAAAASAKPSSSAVDANVRHSITTPRTVGAYRRLTGSVANRLSTTMRKSMEGAQSSGDANVFAKAKIAIYTKSGDTDHPLIFVGLSADDSPVIAKELKSTSPSKEVDSMFVGMGLGDAKDYPAGRFGGVLRCGKGPMSGTTASACAWADSSTAGFLIAPASGSLSTLAATTLHLRNAAEH